MRLRFWGRKSPGNADPYSVELVVRLKETMVRLLSILVPFVVCTRIPKQEFLQLQKTPWDPKRVDTLLNEAKDAKEEAKVERLIAVGEDWPAATSPGADAFILRQTKHLPERYPCKPLDTHRSAASKELQGEFTKLSYQKASTCLKPETCLNDDSNSKCYKSFRRYIARVRTEMTGEGLLWFPLPRSNGGLTNRMNSLVKPFLHAFREQKGFIFPHFANPLIGCFNLTCYFDSPTHCDYPPWLVITPIGSEADGSQEAGDIMFDMYPGNAPPFQMSLESYNRTTYAHRHWILDSGFEKEVVKSLSPMRCDGYPSTANCFLPDRWKKREVGWFWWVSQALHFLWRPNKQMLLIVEMTKKKIGFGGDMIGLHIRHGDSCTETESGRTKRKCEGLEAYMPSVEEISNKYGTNRIFLATDDDAVIEQTKDAEYARYEFVSIPPAMAGRQPVGGRLWTDGNATVRKLSALTTEEIVSTSTANTQLLSLGIREERRRDGGRELIIRVHRARGQGE
jgi:hypothetical protein